MSIRYNHALALHGLGRETEALDEVHAAAAAEPDDPDVQFVAGVVALKLGRTEEARQSFARAVAIDPHRSDAAHNLALLDAAPQAAPPSLSTEGPAADGASGR